MGTFYGPSVNPDEIWHWKYTRRYRKGGKWVYEYPDDVIENTQTYQDSKGNTYVRKDVDVVYNGFRDGKNPAKTTTTVTKNADGSKTIEYTTVRERGKTWAMMHYAKKAAIDEQRKRSRDFRYEKAHEGDHWSVKADRWVQKHIRDPLGW